MGSPHGYSVYPGLYRVPDLLTEQQLVDYMLSTYGRKVEFTDGLSVNPSRALGRSRPVGPIDEDYEDADIMSPASVNDPHLRYLNELDFKQEPVVEEDKEETQKDAPALPVGKSTSKK